MQAVPRRATTLREREIHGGDRIRTPAACQSSHAWQWPRAFYGRLLPELGFAVKSGDDEWRTYQAGGDAPESFFGFTAGKNPQPNENRIAFWAESRAEVDRLAEVARQAGAGKIEGPELVQDYAPGYYAVFFEDPSGNKLEICFRESRPA